MDQETPVLDTLAAMTAVSIQNSDLANRELMLARIGAPSPPSTLPAISYLMNVGAAADAGVTVEDVQGVLIAIAPIIGTARAVSAAAKITEALGFAIAAIAGRARGRARGDGGRARQVANDAGAELRLGSVSALRRRPYRPGSATSRRRRRRATERRTSSRNCRASPLTGITSARRRRRACRAAPARAPFRPRERRGVRAPRAAQPGVRSSRSSATSMPSGRCRDCRCRFRSAADRRARRTAR